MPLLLPVTLLLRVRWPPRSDWPAVAGLGICYFASFFILYNIIRGLMTAARASLALSTLPLQSMIVGALLGDEPLTARRMLGGCNGSVCRASWIGSAVSRAYPAAWEPS